MLSPERELAFLRFLDALLAQLKPMHDPQKALSHALRETQLFVRASAACLAIAQPDLGGARPIVRFPRQVEWDGELLTRVIRVNLPLRRPDILIVPLQRRGGAWAAMGFQRAAAPFDRADERALARLAAAVSEVVQHKDHERVLGVRDRIDRKLMERIHPKDVFYQILDGLRSLTHYDHSSALLIRDDDDAMLRVAAEQIAWTKAKSDRIGLRLAITTEVRSLLESGRVYGFDRRDDRWVEWTGRAAAPLADLLDYNRFDPHADKSRLEQSILVAPLSTREGVLGVLKVAARHPGSLKPYDAQLVEHFRSQAAAAIRNLARTESFRVRMLTAERKHAMAELARSVSHDINNAIGSMLPLVQQMRDDVAAGRIDPGTLHDDLVQLQGSLQVCRRIFGGMLAFARGNAQRTPYGLVRPALETALSILKDGIERRGIELGLEIPVVLPPVACAQGELEQVFLNLLTNAREAMADGGRLTVGITAADDAVRIWIADTGCGIAPEHLPRVQEPFFTTKPHGNGLGLAICRSILWQTGGTLSISSDVQRGTRVDISIPCVQVAQPAPAS